MRGHHLLFTRNTWASQETTKHLRNNHWLIVPMHDEEHQALHEAVTTIPLLDHLTAKRIDREFMPVQNSYLGSIIHLMKIIEESRNHFRASELEKALSGLCIESIELQIPFIRQGIDDGRRNVY